MSEANQFIPKIFHTIWLGTAPLPDHLRRWMESWRQHHPEWEHRHWTDATVPPLRNQEQFDGASIVAQKADLLRYELVARFGGVYLDTDFECFANIEPLLDGVRAFTGLELPARPAIGILGAVPKHHLFLKVLEMIPQRWPYRGNILWETGPAFFASALREWAGEEPAVEDLEVADTGKLLGIEMADGVVLYQPWVFYPYYFNQTWVPEEHPDAFAAHHWEGSWKGHHGAEGESFVVPGKQGAIRSSGPHEFDRIYKEGRWAEGGAAPLSGPGSAADVCAGLCGWIDQLRPASILDVGCGDFTWSERNQWIRGGDCRYRGVDVSTLVVTKNWERFPGYEFAAGDFTTAGTREKAALIVVKDVVSHLGNVQVAALLENLTGCQWEWLVLTHHPQARNTNRVLDEAYCFSRINLRAAPFALPQPTSTMTMKDGVEALLYKRSDWPDASFYVAPTLPRWKSFVIGLPRYRERWTGSLARIKESGTNFEMISGVDAKFTRPEGLVRADHGWPLSSGEIGCYLAHISVLQRVIDYDLDYGIVLEDDFMWIGGSSQVLSDLMCQLPLGADHIQLHSFKSHFFPSYTVIERRGPFNRLSPTNVLTVGYIVSRRMAEIMIAHHAVPDMPIDHKFVELSYDKRYMFFDLDWGIIDVDWSSGSTIERRGTDG